MKIIWFTMGSIALLLALVGVLLPLLPTVPFLLIAAFFFAKSSQRVHSWLINHRLFGKMIGDWHERGAIDRKAKYFATISILLVIVVSLILGIKLLIIGIQVFLLSLVLLFIWTRPDN